MGGAEGLAGRTICCMCQRSTVLPSRSLFHTLIDEENSGFVCVDVTHSGVVSDDDLEDVETTEMSHGEVLMRSRLLEVKVPEYTVENVLAGRDNQKLKVQMGAQHGVSS